MDYLKTMPLETMKQFPAASSTASGAVPNAPIQQTPSLNTPDLPPKTGPAAKNSPFIAAENIKPNMGASRPVSLLVYWDDPLEPPVTATLPSSLWPSNQANNLQGRRVWVDVNHDIRIFTSKVSISASKGSTSGGLPDQLAQLTRGIVLALGAQKTHEVANQIPQATSNAQGNFTASDIDMAQTTAFVAANQVLMLAERAAKRPILWGDGGRLRIRPHAWVGANALELNAYFSHASDDVSMGAFGTVHNGRPAPYSGIGLPFLEHALIREKALKADLEQQGYPDDLENYDSENYDVFLTRRIAVLEQAIDLAQNNRPDEAIKVLQTELAQLDWLTYARFRGQRDLNNLSAEQNAWLEQGKTDYEKRAPANKTKPQTEFKITEESKQQAAWSMSPLLLHAEFQRAVGLLNYLRPLEGVLVQLAKSREVSAHEAGHAALATLKAYLATITGQAFHEAYGDLMSFFTALDRDETIEQILKETGGDLTRSNSATRSGEQYAQAIARATRTPNDDHTMFFRDIANNLTTENFPALKIGERQIPSTPEEMRQLAPHNLSRLFSGTFTEVFGRIANQYLQEAGISQQARIQAVRRARDEAAELLHQALDIWAEDGGMTLDLAASWVDADTRFGKGKHHGIIRKVLANRKILAENQPDPIPESIQAAANASTPLHLSPQTKQAEDVFAVIQQSPYGQFLGNKTSTADKSLLKFRVLEDTKNGHGLRMVRIGFEIERPNFNDLDPLTLKPKTFKSSILSGAFVFNTQGDLIAVHQPTSGIGALAQYSHDCLQGDPHGLQVH
ncbi:MAG: hypothetical protein R3C68_07585 [Myxococcota bacterium]